MISEKELLEILSKLLAKTKEGSIRWSISDNDEFRVSFSRSSAISYRSYADFSADPYFGLKILNSNGDIVGLLPKETTTLIDAQKLEALYQSAQRNALKIEETLSDLKDNLG